MTKQQNIFRLVYVSRNNLPCNHDSHEQEVEHILTSARRNNASRGITGALLFSNDCFAQTLEGPMAEVEALFERILLDTRHSELVVLQAASVERREFGGWSMAYAGRHDAERVRFDALTGVSGVGRHGQVLGLLRGVVLRATPGLVAAA